MSTKTCSTHITDYGSLINHPYKPQGPYGGGDHQLVLEANHMTGTWQGHDSKHVDTFVMTCFRCEKMILRADSRFAPSQWETALLCNDISHWLGANLESVLDTWYQAIANKPPLNIQCGCTIIWWIFFKILTVNTPQLIGEVKIKGVFPELLKWIQHDRRGGGWDGVGGGGNSSPSSAAYMHH